MPRKTRSFCRIQAVQMEVQPGQPYLNLEKMLCFLQAAAKDKADIVVFPEMAIPGRLLGDAWDREAFLRDCETCSKDLRNATANGPAVIFGNVAVDWSKKQRDGRVRKYNACFAAASGQWLAPKTGPYNFWIKPHEYDSKTANERIFFDAAQLALEMNLPLENLLQPVQFGRMRLACVFTPGAQPADTQFNPATMLARKGVDAMLCLDSLPYFFQKNKTHPRCLKALAQTCGTPLIHINHTGIQNNGKSILIFDGASSFFDHNGYLIKSAPCFEESILTVEIPLSSSRKAKNTNTSGSRDGFADLFAALSFGTRRFMEQSSVSRVVIGLSGGIDSAVSAALFSRILPPSHLLLVNMPSPHNADTTIQAARKLSRKLGCFYVETPIEESTALTLRQINGLVLKTPNAKFTQTLHLTEPMMENVQARDRSSRLLAAFASAFGGVFTCNANKAESTIGYSTLYGDLGGFLAPFADLWKGEIYALAKHMNKFVFQDQTIPAKCFTIKPSAELSPLQNVNENMGDPLVYPYHDRLFASWTEFSEPATLEENLAWYHEGTLERNLGYEGRVAELFPEPADFIGDLERWWNLYHGMGAIKRAQAPPFLAIKQASMKHDFCGPLLTTWSSRRYRKLKQIMLDKKTNTQQPRHGF